METEKNHFAAGTHARVKAGVPELLVLRYLDPPNAFGRTKGPRIKFPGGGHKDAELPVQTCERELVEEIAGADFKVNNLQEVFRSPDEGGHIKFFFSFEYQGELRKVSKTEEDRTVLFVPQYEGARSLYYNALFIKTHREPLRRYISFFAGLYGGLFRQLADDLQIESSRYDLNKERLIAAP